MGKRFVKPDKESLKKDFAGFKQDFLTAVKDRKRWTACLIEILIMCALLAVDQLTKHFIYGHCKTDGDIKIIDGVIRFTAVENTGASFGIFKNSTSALTAISIICSIVLLLFIFYSYPRKNKWLRASLVMITAGAIGNVIDRLAFGFVRDMVYFELIDFAVFNFADSCLTIGTAVMVIYILFMYGKDEEEARKNKEAAQKINVDSNEKIDGEETDNDNNLSPDVAETSITETNDNVLNPDGNNIKKSYGEDLTDNREGE